MGSLDSAIKKYSEILNIFPRGTKDVLFERGTGFAMLGELSSALKDFEDFLRLDPSSADGWLNKSVVLNKMGREKEAREAFERSKKLR